MTGPFTALFFLLAGAVVVGAGHPSEEPVGLVWHPAHGWWHHAVDGDASGAGEGTITSVTLSLFLSSFWVSESKSSILPNNGHYRLSGISGRWLFFEFFILWEFSLGTTINSFCCCDYRDFSPLFMRRSRRKISKKLGWLPNNPPSPADKNANSFPNPARKY